MRALRASLALDLHLAPSQVDRECWQDLLDIVAVATNRSEDMEAEAGKRTGRGPRTTTTKTRFVKRAR